MNWYLIITKPNEEERVERQLKEASIDYLSPKIKKTAVKMRRIQTVTEPLFPRYIFVRIDLEKNFRNVRYTRGVAGFIEFGCGPVSVDATIVNEIQSREKDGYIDVSKTGKKFRKNQSLKIKRGLLKDLDVIFNGYLSGEERVSLLIKNISSNIKLNVHKYYL